MDTNKLKLRELTIADVTVTLRCEEEECDLRKHLSSEEPDYADRDEALCLEIEKRVQDGDQWAWCVAIVSVSWGPFKEEATLGCCSYESEEDFRKDGYFDDMVKESVEQLNTGLSKLFEELMPLLEIDTSAA